MITPGTLWEHAVGLQAAAADEVSCRHAASRLYYATFHAVRLLLNFNTAVEHAHDGLIHELKATRAQARVKAGGRLESLKRARVHADYTLGLPFGLDRLRLARSHADAVRQLLGIAGSVEVIPGEAP